MTGDDKDNKDDIIPIADDALGHLTGGRRSTPTTVTGQIVSDDLTIGVNGVSNDTLFAGVGDDISNLNIRKR